MIFLCRRKFSAIIESERSERSENNMATNISIFDFYKEDIKKFNEFCEWRGDRVRENLRRTIIAALRDEALFNEIDKEEPVRFKRVPKSEKAQIHVFLEKETRDKFHAMTAKHKETVVAWLRKYIRYMAKVYEAEKAKQAAEQAKEKERVANKIWEM